MCIVAISFSLENHLTFFEQATAFSNEEYSYFIT